MPANACAIKDRPFYCPECGRWYGGYIFRDGTWRGWCWNCRPQGRKP